MKLCIVTRSVLKGDGQGRVNYEVVREAIRCGHHVTLLASNVELDLQQQDQVQWVNISVKHYPTQLLSSLAFSHRCATWLQQHRTELDLVQANGANTSLWVDINACHFVHSAWLRSPSHISRLRHDSYGLYQWLYTALNAHWERQAFARTNTIVAVSEKVKQELIQIGTNPNHIRVIHNGVDLEEFYPGQVERQPLGLPERVPLAFFAGDIRTSRKNLETVLRALVQVPELHLAVAGDIAGSPYPNLAATLNLGQRVHFLGYRRDIALLMRAVDLFVFPSRYEACTLVLLEAMASGLPVVTATTVGGSELVTPDCGIVLSNSDAVPALVTALQILTQNPLQRSSMGQAARRVAEQYSWHRIAQCYLALFEEVKLLCA
jgi:glycosyltransferase involved in cell wall biosynthesis